MSEYGIMMDKYLKSSICSTFLNRKYAKKNYLQGGKINEIYSESLINYI